MNYLFSGFKLNTTKKELSYQSELVNLTKQNFQLLHYFVKNPGTVLNKDQLIENVWNGRVVADNSIDQSIYKLKKILTSVKEDDYFETVYGLGIKFLPSVETESTESAKLKQQKGGLKTWVVAVLLSVLVAVSFYFWWQTQHVQLNSKNKNSIIVLPNNNLNSQNDWLSASTDVYVKKILKQSPTVFLKDYSKKPKNLNQEQYLESLWKSNPQLKVVNSEVSLAADDFVVKLTIKDNAGRIAEKEFKNKQLTAVYTEAFTWLNTEFQLSSDSLKTSGIIPKEPYLLELYLRGVSAVRQHKVDQAINYFELCLEKDADYHLASLELTILLDRKGDTNKALALLDSVLSITTLPELKIEAANQKGGILLRQGKPQEAKDLYLSLLKTKEFSDYQGILDTRYKLALVYRSLSQKTKALEEFSALELALIESDDYKTLADTYQAKASLLLDLGQTKKALTYVQKAMELFVRQGNLIGQAKTHSVLARIAIQEAEYSQALTHLKQSLNITKSLKHKFGIGATLNEIISVLILQGKINEAWRLNQELEKIAVQIDFTAMLLAAKRYTVILAEHREYWQEAELYLKEHLEIAQAADNRLAIVENHFMSLSVMLKQDKFDKVNEKIEQLENYIFESKEQGLRVKLNIFKAQYLFQTQHPQDAIALLNSSKIVAKANLDKQSIIDINNLLGQIYLKQNEAQQALSVLQESLIYKPAAMPYLLLKSEANQQLNNTTNAIKLANRCKVNAHDLWTSANELYLTELLKIKNSEK
jgi:DNA-binding winged helix-turn-helix (wHTH) protein/tetratricopeptide (TPR) repeat protein